MQIQVVCAGFAVALSSSVAAQELIDPNLQATVVAEGLGSQFGVYTTTFAFIDETTILAARRSDGTVYRIDLVGGDVATPGPVVLDLDIIAPDQTDTQTEYGVQSITLHPDFDSNSWVYIKYDASLSDGSDTPQEDIVLGGQFSASDPTLNVIERYIWDSDANGGVGTLTFDMLIHQVTMDTRFHHGGQIVFDHNNDLFATYGELRRLSSGGWQAQTAGPLLSANLADGVTDDLGVIIRLHDDGSVPADNPFVTGERSGGDYDKWFAYGVRNSFGIAIDPVTGLLWDTQNGEANYDEVNLVLPGSNLGWKQIMGPVDHAAQTGSLENLVILTGSVYHDPRFSWHKPIGATALSFLHGTALGPAYDGTILAAGINNGYLWALPLNVARDGFTFVHEGLQDAVDDRPTSFVDPIGTEAEELLFGTSFGQTFKGVLAITESPSGDVYVLTGEGQLVRISPADIAGDANLDGAVDLSDLLMVIGNWGGCVDNCPPTCDGDVNRDCAVNLTDLLLVIGNWGAGGG